MFDSFAVGSKKEFNYSIEVAGPLQYTQVHIPLPVDPYVLGFWLGNGVRGTSRVSIRLQDQQESVANIESRGYRVRVGGHNPTDCNIYGLAGSLRALGILQEKRIPLQYLRAEVNQRLELLKGLMDANGTVLESGTCEYTLIDKQLAENVLELILGLGFKATLSLHESWFNGERYQDRYRICFNPLCNVFRLARKARYIVPNKSAVQINRYITSIERVPSVPVKCITVDSPSHLYLATRACIATHNSFVMALKLLDRALNTKIIASYKSNGQPLYRGPKIVIVTPFQTQLTVLFDEMQNLLERNPELVSQVVRNKGTGLYTKQPNYKMGFEKPGEDFISGAIIMGYVSGTSVKADGSGGGSLRGESPDFVYMDEMDMIPEDVLSSVIRPFIATNSDVTMYATSTPIGVGRKGYFYRYCKEDPAWVEYYLPSSVLPHWEQVRSEIEAEGTTTEAFKAEFMAEFVESGQGVFKLDHILKATRPYTYDDSRRDNIPWWRNVAGVRETSELVTIIGVDWNKIAGTEMVVVAYDPRQHMWFVCDAVNIPSSEFSTVRFKEALIELNFKWKPDWVYPDEGFGHHVIEDLRWEAFRLASKDAKTPVEAATVRLYDIMKPINFSSKLTIRDPVTYEEKEKYAKELLVQNAVNVLEEGRIWIPESDKVLFNQLAKYVIVRMAASGRLIYGPSDERLGDHRLDAFMLALLGFFIELHPLYAQGSYEPSTPVALSKEDLQSRGSEDQGGFSALVKTLKRMNVGIDLQKINYVRPSPEKDEQLLTRQREMSQTGPTRRRSDITGGLESASKHFIHAALETSGYVINGEKIPLIAPEPTLIDRKGFRRPSSNKRSGRF